MFRTIITCGIVLLGIGCGSAGNGQLTTQARTASGFTRVENESSLAMRIEEGTFQIAVNVDSNLQGAIVTTVAGDTLLVQHSGIIFPSDNASVTVHLPRLDGVTVSGSGEVTALGTASASDVKLVASGSAALHFEGTPKNLDVEVSGSGAMELLGKVERLQVSASGSGSVDGRGLVSTSASLDLSGSGSLSATVQGGTVDFMLSGSGSIHWWGNANVGNVSATGSGSVVHQN